MARTCFVTATDTNVGKTIVAATIVAGLRARGVMVVARKPVVTGVAASPPAGRPRDPQTLDGLPDHELLGAVSGERAEDVAVARYEPPVSPHLAAELAGAPLDVPQIVQSLRRDEARAEALIVEGSGGLLVPLGQSWDIRRLARELGWPVVVVARCGLGTINHTLLTLEAARHDELDVRAVVLTPWPENPGTVERSNRDTIQRLGGIEVATLPWLALVTPQALAGAAQTLSYDRWLSG
ncbi:MAG: dethiobiotin synthase [Solirubrobacteraceae bacterium]|jgi:dethiobiotin synthetase